MDNQKEDKSVTKRWLSPIIGENGQIGEIHDV